MNETSFRQLIGDHARFPGALLHIFQGADEALLREREAPRRWSPLEILAHLRDEETEDFRARARAAVEGGAITLSVDPQTRVRERRYNDMDPGAVYLEFARERAESCRWLETLGMEELERAVEHPRFGRLRAGDLIAAWRIHDLLHLRQFAAAIAILTARRLEGWRIEYAGEIPHAGPREP